MSVDLFRFTFAGIASWVFCCATGHKPEHEGTTVCLCGSSLWRKRD